MPTEFWVILAVIIIILFVYAMLKPIGCGYRKYDIYDRYVPRRGRYLYID